jgi:hypothetical protein
MDTAGLFEWFAQESMRAAEQAKEPRQHEMYLRLAFMWAAAAQHSRCEERATQYLSIELIDLALPNRGEPLADVDKLEAPQRQVRFAERDRPLAERIAQT